MSFSQREERAIIMPIIKNLRDRSMASSIEKGRLFRVPGTKTKKIESEMNRRSSRHLNFDTWGNVANKNALSEGFRGL